MKLKSLRYRQIHLDFHTSPAIERIGAAFDKKEWQETLQAARVDSITCFSKCHHGLSYHPTKVGTMHPHLKFDLLRAQMDACREIDVKVPVYLSVGYDNVIGTIHPEWRIVSPLGALFPTPLEPGFHRLCLNSPYLGYLCRQIEEAVTLFPEADGLFLDIIYLGFQAPCCCTTCLESMAKLGLDATREEDRNKHGEWVRDRYFREATAACKVLDAAMPVFHNSSHVLRGRRHLLDYQSHLELESLPTGGWGYDHFPESATYVSRLGFDYLGMTGKFHRTWGEFGGFKHPNALRYECAAMNAYGAKCSVGDQLHPDGRLDVSTYELIGPAFREVEAREPWLRGTEPVYDIAVLSAQAEQWRCVVTDMPDSGAARLLAEGHYLFSLIDREADFAAYRLLILPDLIAIDAALKTKIDAYLQQGGRLLLTGTSGLVKDGAGYAFDIGAEHGGTSPFSPDYIVPDKPFRAPFVNTPLVMYVPSQRLKVKTGRSLGHIYDPYFNRTFRHFCSHFHTPNRPEPSGYDCGVLQGSIATLAHPVFTLYYQHGAIAYKEYVLRVIDVLLDGKRTVSTGNFPSTGRLTLQRQPAEKREVIHLLYANKHARGAAAAGDRLEVIEELEPIHDVSVTVCPEKEVARVTLEPQGVEIPHAVRDGVLTFNIASFAGSQLAVLHQR